MKFAYKFSNLLGTVYRKGDLIFTPDGNSVISTVGNRISIFDLKNNKSTTLPVESRFNYNALDLSPNGCTLIAINEEGDAHMISLISQTIIHKYRFKRKVRAVKFSPDSKHFAVCKENNVFVFKAPGPFSGQYNAFIMERVYHGAYDETTCLDWSTDSRILAVGSKDMATKLYPLDKWANFRIYSLGNHTDGIVGCFFEEGNYDITTVSRNGQTCVWECTIDPKDLVPIDKAPPRKKKKISSDSEEDDVDVTKSRERTEEEITAALNEVSVNEEAGNKTNEVNKLFYKRIARHYLGDEVRKDNRQAVLTAAAYHRKTRILVTGYSTGAFFIHELPEVNLIHSLSISDQKVSSISLNCTGDWIALGCSGLGQLLVWEWQSETYVMKQQGHSNNMSCVSYSTDGQLLATGGEDGKVKLWNVHSGFCFVTFNEHSNSVTAITFSGNKKFVVSASLDGTVRAYDVLRYRNFRTFTSTRPVQFSCVAVDSSGEFVAAGGQDIFEIYLWSVKTGRLLEILAGHEGPVSSLAFSPIMTSTVLASVSWDKTLRVWDAIEKGSAHETIELTADGICVVFKPDGQDVAVATLDGQISIFNVKTSLQVSSIEGRNDLGSGRSDTDLITAKKSLQAKSFTSLCYSADGECLLAGGQSKNVCIYNVKESLLLRRFEITQNRSLDAVDDFINRRKLTEFGNVALIEEREEREGGNVSIRLPGVRKGDMASRVFKPEVRVFSLQFSPTGQQWAAATTEGLLIYSLNSDLVFDPWDLQIGITPAAVREAVEEQDFANALIMSMKLNEAKLIQEVIESIPTKDIELIIAGLGTQYVQRLLIIIASCLDSSRHLEYYLCWAQHILTMHGPKINAQKNMPALLALEKSLVRKYDQISKICDYNKYTLQYISSLGDVFSKKLKLEKMDVESEDDEEAGGSDVSDESNDVELD
ncbi:periodic tryptophan protein 2 homolog [Anoplophora glabripennis]|uniref:periodic tryptophan protein 2 homolog n=1 Tax=Anoplophora glabripennis TaxID=217634 RepID=UPI000874908B|nr:periodic tryptophan protein 2 homolog [Anoplophora glabripennis]